MDRDSPCEPEWNLRERCFDFAIFLHSPLLEVGNNLGSIKQLNHRQSLESSNHMSERTICVSGFEVVFYKHHTGSDFENKCLWRKASFFECFYKTFRTFCLHFEDKCIIVYLIQSFFVVGIDRNISRKKLGMVIGRHWYISRHKEFSRTRRYSRRRW